MKNHNYFTPFSPLRGLCALFIFLLLAACGHHQQYVQQLNEANQRQKGDSLFTEVNEMKSLVDYFSRHGSANERMLAHYLLGRAYADSGEAPMAIDCYMKAAECADTTQADCNYWQLSRVYSQMANIYYWQDMYREQIKCLEYAEKYAYQGQDTLTAISSFCSKASAYEMLNISDSVIRISEESNKKFLKSGLEKEAAAALGMAILPVLEKSDTAKAREFINIYESKSGYFDNNNNIECGREIYYHIKGMFFMAIGKLDSAEYIFRKELNIGRDYNNQVAASHGLALVYKKKHQADSVGKYALYAYDMNDSVYSQSHTTEIEKLQRLYNYSRFQNIAKEESLKAEKRTRLLWILLLAFLLLSTVVGFCVYHIRQKRQTEKLKYKETLGTIEQLQSDIMSMRLHEDTYKNQILEKEKLIENLQTRYLEIRNRKQMDLSNAEQELTENLTYQYIKTKAYKGEKLTEEDWRRVRMMIIETLPQFYGTLSAKEYALNINEYNTCVLIRLHVKPQEISNMLEITKAAVSKIREKLLYKIFGIEGKAKEFDERILQLS